MCWAGVSPFQRLVDTHTENREGEGVIQHSGHCMHTQKHTCSVSGGDRGSQVITTILLSAGTFTNTHMIRVKHTHFANTGVNEGKMSKWTQQGNFCAVSGAAEGESGALLQH